MRINHLDAAPAKATRNLSEVQGGAADSFLQEVSRIQREKINQELEAMVRGIEEAGERLAATMSLDDLVAYKRLIGDFLRAVNHSAVQVQTSLSWGYMGQQRHYTIVREIDASLARLRDLIMEEEKDHLNIVALVDNIRGLVLDLRL